MRFLMKISVPNEPFNSYVKNGSAGNLMQQILADVKPEAAYFAEMNGGRTAVLIVNMDQTSQMAHFAEPWFIKFDAKVEFHPVMSGEDLAKSGLDAIGKKWG
jgi:hypothetical protein